MADPLSISASIVALGGVIVGILKVALAVRGALDEVRALINEVTDLQVLLKDVDHVLTQERHRDVSLEGTESLVHTLSKAKRTVQLLNEFVRTHLIKEEDCDQVRISKRSWLRDKPLITKFQRQLHTCRGELNNALAVANLSLGSRVELSVANIVSISEETRTMLAEQGEHTQELVTEMRSLKHLILVNARDGLQWTRRPDKLSRTSREWPSDKIKESADKSSGIEVQVLWQPPFSCSPVCFCVCHNMCQSRSPRILDRVLGSLFVGYTGLPFLRPQCDSPGCRRKRIEGMKLSYYFPNWFVQRMVTFTYMMKPCNRLQVSLKVARVVDNGAQIFKMTQTRNLEGIKALFTRGLASPLDVGHLDGNTALHFAVLRGYTEIVDFLLKNSADKDALDTGFETPTSLAWDVILSKTMDTDTRNYYHEVFSSSDVLDGYNFSYLHHVILGFKHGNLEDGISRYPALIDSVDSRNNTPLLWASLRGNTAAVEVLLRFGANPDCRNDAGESSLLNAARQGSTTCVRALVNAGACNLKDQWQMSPLHKACDLHDEVALVALLLNRKIEIDCKDIFSRTPLALASWRNHHRVTRYLLCNGADVEATDIFGATPLLRAIQYTAVEVAAVLLGYGADPLAADKNGQTILHRAALSRSQRVLDFLTMQAVQHLAQVDVDAKDASDMTAKDRLLELEPTADLLAAFTRLTTAITKAKENAEAMVGKGGVRKFFPSYELGSEASDSDAFVDASESWHYATTESQDQQDMESLLLPQNLGDISTDDSDTLQAVGRRKKHSRFANALCRPSWAEKYYQKFRAFDRIKTVKRQWTPRVAA